MASHTEHRRPRAVPSNPYRHDPGAAGRRDYRWVPTLHHRVRHAPRQLHADAVSWLIGIGLGATLSLGVRAESLQALRKAGGLATAGGRLAGLAAAYLLLVLVLLVSRLPAIERSLGHDKLVRLHRRIAPFALLLLAAHGALITIGYAQAARRGVLHEFGVILTTLPGMVIAAIGFVLFLAAGVTSYRLARRRMRHETWWLVHLFTYLAIVLSFSHQVATGASFVSDPVARVWWTGLYVTVGAAVVWYRVLVPAWRSIYHSLRVVAVYPEATGIVSVVLEGRRVERLAVNGGQFFQWRFLRRGLWWQAHPYSISAMPQPPYLRVTVKGLGDHSAELARLTAGTRVAIEGPYGVFTRHAAAGHKLALVGAGVGVTPIRAMLEDLPNGADIDVVLRANSLEELVLDHEIGQLVAQRGGRVHRLVGDRGQIAITPRSVRALIPDLHERDLYICGPEGFARRFIAVARQLGVKRDCIHHEEFAF